MNGGEGDRDFLEWGGGTLGGDHQDCCGCGGRGFRTRGCFFLACLEAAVDLSLGFLGVVVSLVVTIRSRAPP